MGMLNPSPDPFLPIIFEYKNFVTDLNILLPLVELLAERDLLLHRLHQLGVHLECSRIFTHELRGFASDYKFHN